MIDAWPVRVATPDDLEVVVKLLNQSGSRLANAGYDQWGHDWMTTSRMATYIERREAYVAHTGGEILATVSFSKDPGPFWTDYERSEPAIYMGKLARADTAPRGIGDWLANVWGLGWAYQQGYTKVRLDAWRANPDLHAWYDTRGWTYVRTEVVDGNASGVLYERPSRPAPGQVPGTCDA